MLTREKNPKDKERFDYELNREPTAGPASHGTRDLMAVMQQFGGAARGR